MVGHDRVHDRRAIVRQHHLLEQAPQHLAHAIVSSPFVEVAGGAELGQHVARPFNGPGEHLRKEAHKSEEGGRIAHRLQFAAVHIKGVTEALERVETDAHRQHQAERILVRVAADPADRLVELVGPVRDEVGRADGQQLQRVRPALAIGQRVEI